MCQEAYLPMLMFEKVRFIKAWVGETGQNTLLTNLLKVKGTQLDMTMVQTPGEFPRQLLDSSM